MRSYFVYMLQCADGSYYTGVTNDVERRVSSHVVGNDPSSYTFKRRPLQLVYTAEFREVYDAISWEKQVKRWNRKKKEALIVREYERLPRLSRNRCTIRIDALVSQVHRKYAYVIVQLCHGEPVEPDTTQCRPSTGSG